jgi:7-keto-8-aminopelargonate synthetase-like enzyme
VGIARRISKRWAVPTLQEIISLALDRQREANLLRQRRVVRHLDATHVEIEGRRYVSFAGNDYLGLASRALEGSAPSEPFPQARSERSPTLQYGSGASALITGYSESLAQAERKLAQWKGTEGAVILPSGYQANHAAVQSIVGVARAAGKRVRFLIDKLVHASLVDAVRGSGESFRVFGHNDVGKLRRLLDGGDSTLTLPSPGVPGEDNKTKERAEGGELQVVVTESIFSMDGDAAELREIVKLKRERPFVLLLDEAHATGVYGECGRGYAAELGVGDEVDVCVITMSKAMGCMGGAICGSSAVCDAVVNFGRAYIYSTAVPPLIAAACATSIEMMNNEPQRQARVRELARRVRKTLGAKGMKIPAGDSPIIPVIVGSEEAALRLSDQLLEKEILVPAVRPPTVPRGRSRLRVTLSSAHSDSEIDQLASALVQAGN